MASIVLIANGISFAIETLLFTTIGELWCFVLEAGAEKSPTRLLCGLLDLESMDLDRRDRSVLSLPSAMSGFKLPSHPRPASLTR